MPLQRMASLSSGEAKSPRVRYQSYKPRRAASLPFLAVIVAYPLMAGVAVPPPLSFAGGPLSATGCARRLVARPAGSPYDIIGAPRGAPKEEVRRVFRKLALTKHPDVNPENPLATEEFADLVSAYNAIMGDELSKSQLADELEQMRAEARVRYEKSLKTELKGGQVAIAVYRVFELCAGLFLLWTTTQGPEVLSQLGILPTNCDVRDGKCYPVNILPAGSSAPTAASSFSTRQNCDADGKCSGVNTLPTGSSSSAFSSS